jgi:hypothetical protein
MRGAVAVLAAVAIGLTVAGCGGSNPLDSGLGRFLVRPGEEPGFSGGKVTVNAAQGRETTSGSEGLDGASGVLVLASAGAAQAKARALLRAPVGGGFSARGFAVPGVPGAKGLLEDSPDEGDNAGVVWVQGRCVLIIGDLAVSGTAATTPLVSAAQAVYKRTRGLTCG